MTDGHRRKVLLGTVSNDPPFLRAYHMIVRVGTWVGPPLLNPSLRLCALTIIRSEASKRSLCDCEYPGLLIEYELCRKMAGSSDFKWARAHVCLGVGFLKTCKVYNARLTSVWDLWNGRRLWFRPNEGWQRAPEERMNLWNGDVGNVANVVRNMWSVML